MNQALLGVNIDHVATLRQARRGHHPSVVQAALVAEQAGADAITIHLREDRRHIQDEDVRLLSATIGTRMNLEMAVTDEMVGIAERLRPSDVCFVPERREELTTEGGLDVCAGRDRIAAACQRLAAAGVRVSLFIDADPEQLELAAAVGAPVVELHTGAYAESYGRGGDEELARLRKGVEVGRELGLVVNAGHGLDYHNIRPVAVIDGIAEFNIGHAIVSRAVFTGLDVAVRDMRRLINAG